ncbi:HdeD family acid-resistance protein [Bradyrhizobium pachyrhizi]|uniref:HdeD family acid-resistance protein n=1 Tax=Bradyrhizobium pachyrhizi TaxID=280333 RepID=A0A844SR78_9BRAD|nr:HdeD family acid-resistance protein [Bradyrhizobium pachyrhizi]MVT64930.1 HdeD family acid-resistance protein [Bradyrhizobium pachyrhizi]
MSEARAKWGWFVALGILFACLGFGAVSDLLLATVATIFYIGALITVAGVFQIIHALGVKSWRGFLLWGLGGLFYAAAGTTIILDPAIASLALTLVLAVFTVASGFMRLLLSFKARRDRSWGWLFASGLLTAIAGLAFLLGWPLNSLWLLGLLLSIDLIFQGCTLIGLGLQLRNT